MHTPIIRIADTKLLLCSFMSLCGYPKALCALFPASIWSACQSTCISAYHNLVNHGPQCSISHAGHCTVMPVEATHLPSFNPQPQPLLPSGQAGQEGAQGLRPGPSCSPPPGPRRHQPGVRAVRAAHHGLWLAHAGQVGLPGAGQRAGAGEPGARGAPRGLHASQKGWAGDWVTPRHATTKHVRCKGHGSQASGRLTL